MNKSELIDAITKKLPGVSKKTVGDVVGAFTDTVASTLIRGDSLTVAGFGTFSVTKRRARTGRDPRTGEALKISARRAVRFSAGATLKGTVNKHNKQYPGKTTSTQVGRYLSAEMHADKARRLQHGHSLLAYL